LDLDFKMQQSTDLYKNNPIQYIIIVLTLTFLFSCAEREKQNPFDPTGSAPITLSVTSRGQRVDLSWSNPDLSDFTGFNVYRKKETSDSAFNLLAIIQSSGTRNYSDNNVEFRQLYSYYVTIVGQNQESKPSNTVSITPGPGYNWVVDKWGFQIIKTTYDAEHLVLYYYTNYPPSDMAVAKPFRIGLITFPSAGLVEVIGLINGDLIETIDQITYPYVIAYDSSASNFWLGDSSGYLYKIDAETRNVELISSALRKPIFIHIAEQVGLISVVDLNLKEIVQFDRAGDVVNKITEINGQSLSGPRRFLYNEKYDRYWLSDGISSMDFIYTKNRIDDQFMCIDTLPQAIDLELSKYDDKIWLIDFKGFNSSLVQLSHTGIRQLEISGLYEPFDIQVNKYDGTLLIAESGRGRLLHYNNELQLLGMFTPLNFPVKVIVE